MAQSKDCAIEVLIHTEEVPGGEDAQAGGEDKLAFHGSDNTVEANARQRVWRFLVGSDKLLDAGVARCR